MLSYCRYQHAIPQYGLVSYLKGSNNGKWHMEHDMDFSLQSGEFKRKTMDEIVPFYGT